MVRIYTRKGDDGSTGLLYGGRVRKDSPQIEANGAVDEAQAALGIARAEAAPGSEIAELVVSLERDLWTVMAEIATSVERRDRLEPGTSMVTEEMVGALERRIDDLSERFEMPKEFVVPGQNRISAALDLARSITRRAERLVVKAGPPPGSFIAPYLNRLSDLLWTMARWQEGEHLITRTAREAGARGHGRAGDGTAG